MPYIGAHTLKASDIKRQTITGSTSATHTLDWTPPNEQSLIVTINGVKQHDASYSITGTNTLTLTSALVSTDEMEIIGINDVGTTITPAEGSVGASHLADNSITNAKINSSAAIAMSKLATDPTNASNLVSGTVPTARLGSGTASSSVFLRGDQSWASAGVSNDYVNVALSADQAMTKNVITKVQFNTEVYDPNGWWDSATNYRFQPDQSGYYLVIAHLGWNNAGSQYDVVDGYVYKNGSEFMHGETLYRAAMQNDITISCIAQLNGSTDYLEIYARHGTNDNPPLDATGFNGSTATNNMASFVRLT